jgi:polysaccharide pyruvyl transferase WcaK-like protein
LQLTEHVDEERPQARQRIALLTPYNGGNLGDAAIQDAFMANIRARLPQAVFSGISLNCDNFLVRHGANSFPLCASNIAYFGMTGSQPKTTAKTTSLGSATLRTLKSFCKSLLLRLPGVRSAGKMIQPLAVLRREIRHCVDGGRFLKGQDLLVVSGGGQLDDEWGGPWGHPYALLKWAIIARITGVPIAFASVGAGRTSSAISRYFLSQALRIARYRSYRDENSKKVATSLFSQAKNDPVIPDVAFSLRQSELPAPAQIGSFSQSRTVIAISPIRYGRAGSWPHENRSLYDRYLKQMATLVSQLLERGYMVVLLCSALADSEIVIPELLGRIEDERKVRFAGQIHVPDVSTWQDFAAVLRAADFLIASRLHSTIFGFLTQTPTIAISFDPKVDWVMEDLGQTDYLLQIRDFTAKDVIAALDQMTFHRNAIVDQIISYQCRIVPSWESQYDSLAKLAVAAVQDCPVIVQ